MFKRWLDKRRRRKERDAFLAGHNFASEILKDGRMSPEALECYANGTFNSSYTEVAFDRGVTSAVAEHKEKLICGSRPTNSTTRS